MIEGKLLINLNIKKVRRGGGVVLTVSWNKNYT